MLPIPQPQNTDYILDGEGFLRGIKWNNEELKAAVSTTVQNYKNLIYTDDQIKEAKKDRADLNKAKKAVNDYTVHVKKKLLEPYNMCKIQADEIIDIINEGVKNIDDQIKEYESKEREEKWKKISEAFDSMEFRKFVTLEKIFDKKWLNKTYTMKQIKADLENRKQQIENEITEINNLDAFRNEAMIVYENSLNIEEAKHEADRRTEIQNRLEEKAREEKPQEEINLPELDPEEEAPAETMKTVSFQITGTAAEIQRVRDFLSMVDLPYTEKEA